MGGMLPAPLAEFLHIKLLRDKLLILAGIVIHPIALRALELDQIFAVFGLCHTCSILGILYPHRPIISRVTEMNEPMARIELAIAPYWEIDFEQSERARNEAASAEPKPYPASQPWCPPTLSEGLAYHGVALHKLITLSQWPESNWRPTPYHGVALPTELHWRYQVVY
jgi:hypothetical protein